MRDPAQIILGVFILAAAITAIPMVYYYGNVFFGSTLGAQVFIASFGFLVTILQVCHFVLLVDG